MKVYLCGPINGCTDEECKDWRMLARQRLPETIDPLRRDFRGIEDEHYTEIVETDKADIEKSDILLVNYDRPSVGTAMEILWAWLGHKPVVVVAKPGALISPWLRYHSTHIVHSFAEALSLIEDWQ